MLPPDAVAFHWCDPAGAVDVRRRHPAPHPFDRQQQGAGRIVVVLVADLAHVTVVGRAGKRIERVVVVVGRVAGKASGAAGGVANVLSR